MQHLFRAEKSRRRLPERRFFHLLVLLLQHSQHLLVPLLYSDLHFPHRMSQFLHLDLTQTFLLGREISLSKSVHKDITTYDIGIYYCFGVRMKTQLDCGFLDEYLNQIFDRARVSDTAVDSVSPFCLDFDIILRKVEEAETFTNH
jgi:hypothetical protein